MTNNWGDVEESFEKTKIHYHLLLKQLFRFTHVVHFVGGWIIVSNMGSGSCNYDITTVNFGSPTHFLLTYSGNNNAAQNRK